MTTLPTDVMHGGDFIPRAEFDEYNDWREQQGRPRITSFKTRAHFHSETAAKKYAMATLPAMSDEAVSDCFRGAAIRNNTRDDALRDFAQRLIAARDAQWAAAVDAAVMQEREACAKVCDEQAEEGYPETCAKVIRARTKEKT